MEDYKELSNEQFGAIKRSINLGRTLQKEHPEIAVIYRYYSQRDIPEMLDIQSEYGVGDGVARTGIRYAINGHEGSFGIEGYVGLITDEGEREWLGREHNVQSSRKAGRKKYEQRVGIHGRTAEQMSEDARKSAIAKGQTPWTDEEKEYAYMLSQEQEYQRGSLVNNELIALELNIQYHDCKEVRSTKAVTVQLSKYKKSLVDIVV
jgi:hypothetical protein